MDPCKECKVVETGEQKECGFCREDYAVTHMLPIRIGGRPEIDYLCWRCVEDYTQAMQREIRNRMQRCGDCGSPSTEPKKEQSFPSCASTTCEVCEQPNWFYGGIVGCGNKDCENYSMDEAHRLYQKQLEELKGKIK